MRSPKQNWRTAAAVFVLGILGAGLLQADGPRFSIRPWLKLSAVTALTQTRDGYLWLGTIHGLVRFDGFNFTTFDENNTPGLGGSRIFHLYEDSRSNLWIGTDTEGIKLVKDGQVNTLEQKGGLRTGRLRFACEDAEGSVWLGTETQVLRCHGSNVDAPMNLTASSLTADKDGPMWLATSGNLFTSGTTPPKALTGPWQRMASVTNVDFLLASARGGIWCLADGQVRQWRSNRVEKDFGPYPWNQNYPVTAACEDKQGNLIVGTYGGGIFWLNADGRSTNFTRISHEQGLSADNISSLAMDDGGILWAGTDGLGLNRIERALFEVLNEKEVRVAQSVCEDKQGGLWVGINGDAQALQYWKNGMATTNIYNTNSLLVHSVFVDRDDRVWVGTWGPWDEYLDGLFFLTTNRAPQPVFTESILSEGVLRLKAFQAVSVIYQDLAGQLWIGSREGLFARNGRDWKNVTPEDTRAIADDGKGNIWIGTDGAGLGCLRDGHVTVYHKKDGLPSEHITALLVDDAGILWIGTTGGLASFKDGEWTRYSQKDGLASNGIAYLLEDGQGFLWIGSNAGLMRVQKKMLADFARGEAKSIALRVYGEADGLPSSECTSGSQPAACRTREGKLWFPTIRGLAGLNPAQIQTNTNAPRVMIESVGIEGRPEMVAGLRSRAPAQVTVPASSEHLEIQYTSLNLGTADETRFRYQMEGYEAKPNDAGNRRIAPYSKLPAGHYQFRVTAANEDGVWNTAGAVLAVTVLPPFWETWWFRSLLILALVGLITAVVHYVSTQRLQQQLAGLRQQQALEKERSRIARDIHDQLGASLTQVSLLGEMVESDKDSPGEVEVHARQISQTARDTSRTLDEIVWTVNPSNDTLEGLVTYLCKYAQEYLGVAGLRYRLDAPTQLPDAVVSPEARHNVFLAAKEAVTNIVRHAHATSAWLRLRLEDSMFIVEIQDDGRGIPNVAEKMAGSRNGLRNMAKRMEDVGGRFEIVPAPGGGSIVRLAVPVKKRCTMSTRISIVEDNEQLRGTLARLIDREEGLECVSNYGTAEAALEHLPKDKPEVVLMDINLPGMNGVECVRQLKPLLPDVLVVMLTAYEDTENIFNALAAGAAGYLLKRAPRAELLEAIREVCRGGSPMTPHIARKVVQSFQKPVAATQQVENLSEREQEVLDCLSQGFLYKEIAEKLGISYETVHTYIRRIYEKLQVRTRTEAVAKFLKR